MVKTKKGTMLVKLLEEKKAFLVLVFSNLITQLGITYYTMMHFPKQGEGEGDKDGYPAILYKKWFLFLSILGILIVMAFLPMNSFFKFILFSIFSAFFGIMLSSIRENKYVSIAVAGTLCVFVAMFSFGLLSLLFNFHFGYNTSSLLFYSLILLIVVAFVFSQTNQYFTRAISIAALVLFSLYIIYDTNHILQRNYYGDFITASMDYYLDIINIFTSIPKSISDVI
jgi:FtsH-binding integral membrane protein